MSSVFFKSGESDEAKFQATGFFALKSIATQIGVELREEGHGT